MGFVLLALGGIFLLIAIVCHIIILIDAFKSSVLDGFLTLCIGCYALYYMFAKFEHPKKGLILAGYFGGSLIAGICFGIAMPMLQPDPADYGTYPGSYGY